MFVDDLDAMDDIKREDQEEGEQDGQVIITHNYEEYFQDNFRKNEKGEAVGQNAVKEEDEEEEMEENGNGTHADQGKLENVDIDENAFAGEEDLDDLPDDV